MVSVMKPDITVALADDITNQINSTARCTRSLQRSIKWLDDMCKAMDNNKTTESTTTDSAAAADIAVQHPASPLLFASIVGGGNTHFRVDSAKQMSQRAVAGFVLNAFGTGESPEQRHAMIQAIVVSVARSMAKIVISKSVRSCHLCSCIVLC